MKSIYSLLLLLLLPPCGFAQEAKGILEADKDMAHIPETWEASWIWVEEEEQADAIFARRSFELAEVDLKAYLRITASSQYQLYVNGHYVSRGPARSAPHHQSFDTWDITSLLREGKNTLAVRVHYQRGKFSYHHEGRAGLLAQLDFIDDDAFPSITTDPSWKVKADISWDNQAPRINRFQLVPSDRVDLQKYPYGWQEPDYDDKDWGSASPLMRKVGWPSPQKNASPLPLTPPWTSLIRRDLPYIPEPSLKALNLIQAAQSNGKVIEEGILIDRLLQPLFSEQLPFYQNGTAGLGIPATDSPQSYFLLFDLGQVYHAMPQLEIEGPIGSKIDILCAAFIVDEHFTHKIVDSDFRDKIVLSGKKDTWEATYFKPTRYLGLLINSKSEAIQIHKVGIRHFAYPFERQGFIRSDDGPWINQYMKATEKTLKACTTDAYTDNYRERRQYAQTNYYASLGNYYTFGDHALQRRYLIQVAQEQQANGIMPAYAPLSQDDFMIILDSNCLWIRGLRNYLLYSGDTLTVRKLLPAARKLMVLLQTYTNLLGMIENPPYPYWLDHARIDRRGANFTLNGHYLGALEDFSELLGWLGEKGSKKYAERAKKLRNSLQTYLWSPQEGLFADAHIKGKRSDQFSEHTNAMALALRIATEEQAAAITQKLLEEDELNYIKRASGMTMVTPALSYFLHKGLCEYGFTDESFELFRKRFDKMLAPKTNQTLWEEWWLDGTGRSGKLRPKSRSDAQTESAFPPALFAEYLVGLTPTKPGLTEMRISRPNTSLRHVEAKVPTPQGPLEISWKFQETEGGELAVRVPPGMEINLDHYRFKKGEQYRIKINGRKLALKHADKEHLSMEPISLGAGSHKVRF